MIVGITAMKQLIVMVIPNALSKMDFAQVFFLTFVTEPKWIFLNYNFKRMSSVGYRNMKIFYYVNFRWLFFIGWHKLPKSVSTKLIIKDFAAKA